MRSSLVFCRKMTSYEASSLTITHQDIMIRMIRSLSHTLSPSILNKDGVKMANHLKSKYYQRRKRRNSQKK